jgi:hypothetical protein
MNTNNRLGFANDWAGTGHVAAQIALVTSEMKMIKESILDIRSEITGLNSAISSLTGVASRARDG